MYLLYLTLLLPSKNKAGLQFLCNTLLFSEIYLPKKFLVETSCTSYVPDKMRTAAQFMDGQRKWGLYALPLASIIRPKKIIVF